MMKSQRSFPVYPILFSLYPVLSLLAYNIAEVDPYVGLRPVLLSVATFLAVWGAAFLIYRNLHKSALLTTVVSLIFYSYGHVYDAIQSSSLKILLGHHSVLGGMSILLLAGVVWFLRRNRPFNTITQALNMIAAVLVTTSIVPIVSYRISLNQEMDQNRESQPLKSPTETTANYPDVYYIILDSYTRTDSLKRDFDLDTSGFLDAMRERGFYVADCARSNYSFTELSMASAFNMNYVEALNTRIQPGSRNLTLATALIKQNAVRKEFESHGYKIAAFETGYAWNYWEDADLFLKDEGNLLTSDQIQPFEYLLLDTTALKAVSDLYPQAFIKQDGTIHHARHVKRTLYELDELGKLPDLGAPKFVYAHINVPHVPFIFKSDGSLLNNPDYYRGDKDYPVSEEYYVAGYRNQVEFISQRILQTVDRILLNSSVPPVIIIQGDHGIRAQNRLQILNLYLIPGGTEELYSSITPVNSFRVIFNTLFQSQYPLLEDRSYTSTYELPYDLEEVEENSPRCLAQ